MAHDIASTTEALALQALLVNDSLRIIALDLEILAAAEEQEEEEAEAVVCLTEHATLHIFHIP